MPVVVEVIEEFRGDTRNQVHFEIQMFMARYGTFGAVTKKDKVFEKMKELIYEHTVRGGGEPGSSAPVPESA